MDRDSESEKHYGNSERYLDQTSDGYSINPHTGLYEPTPRKEAPEVSQNRRVEIAKNPLPVHVERDWKDRLDIFASGTSLLIASAGILISLFTAILLLFTVIFAKKQWEEMHTATVFSGQSAQAAADAAIATKSAADAAKSAADAAVTSIRPWMRIKTAELQPGAGPVKTLGFHWPITGAIIPPMLQLKITTVNVGHSPAQDHEIIPELFFGKFDPTKWHDAVIKEERRYCNSVIHRAPSGAATIVFPEEPDETAMGVGGIFNESDITQEPGSTRKYSSAALILCVNYKGAGISYQTQAWFGLYENNSILIPINVDVDADKLRLIREPNGDETH